MRDRRSFLRAAALGGAAFGVRAWRVPARAAADGELHLALLSDTHVPADRKDGHRGFSPWENLRAAVPQVVATRPDGVLVCGDLARLEGRLEDYVELRALLEPVAAVAPVYCALGNHDDRDNLRRAYPEPPGRLAPVPGRQVTIVEHPALRVVVLDSLLYVNRVAGLLGQAQRAWLDAALPALADRPLVLFVHHPPNDSDGDLLDGERLLAACRANRQVKAVFHGHAHVWSVARRGGLPVVSLPALGYNFDDAQPIGWVDARFDARGAALTLRALAGKRSDDGRTTRLDWD